MPTTPPEPRTDAHRTLIAQTGSGVIVANGGNGVHIAADLLRAERHDAEAGGLLPRQVVPVTGPSRPAGMGRMLELGAHGPGRLHVVLIEDDPAARAA